METDKIVKHECNDAHSRLSKLSESHFQPKDKMQGFFLDRRNSVSNRADYMFWRPNRRNRVMNRMIFVDAMRTGGYL